MAERAHLVCIEEATKVNSFFVCYGRTFAFRNQTYLISYCVYTAATVEVHEVNCGTRKAAEMAAKRLATTVNMLETEARQTPGVRRSVEIIRSQLRLWSNHTQQQANSNGEGATNAQQHQELGTPTMNRPLSTSEGTDTGDLGPLDHAQQAQSHSDREYIAPASADNVFNEGLQNSSDATGHLEFVNPISLTESFAQDQLLLEREYYDFSGGFAPDMTTWTWQDMVMYE